MKIVLKKKITTLPVFEHEIDEGLLKMVNFYLSYDAGRTINQEDVITAIEESKTGCFSSNLNASIVSLLEIGLEDICSNSEEHEENYLCKMSAILD